MIYRIKNYMSFTTNISVALLSLLLPATAVAEAPASVVNITAEQRGQDVHLEWQPAGNDIAFYRVYYSSVSILENGGLYDDYEVTPDATPSFDFAIPFNSSSLFFSVIAVNTAGEESEYFVEEASVVIDDDNANEEPALIVPTEESEGIQMNPEGTEDPGPTYDLTSPVSVLAAEVVSPTEILITFSAPITVKAEKAPEGLQIVDAKDKQLQIERILIDQDTVVIFTKKQTKGVVYNIQFSEPFKGVNGQPLSDSERSVLITGHTNGKEPMPSTTRESDPQHPPDIVEVESSYELQDTGYYNVVIKWQVDNTPDDLVYYVVYQTRDGGQTWSDPAFLPIDIAGVQLPNVTPGPYGMFIRTLNKYGIVSQGVFEEISLPVYVDGYGWIEGNLLKEVKEEKEASPSAKATEDKEEAKEYSDIVPLRSDDPVIVAQIIGQNESENNVAAAEEEVEGTGFSWITVGGWVSLIFIIVFSVVYFVRHRRMTMA